MAHLQTKQEYIDRYDRITVDVCRRKEAFHKKDRFAEEKTDLDASMETLVDKLSLYFDLFYAKLHWWQNKANTVQKWMEEDRHRDELIEEARAPKGIRCLNCRTILLEKEKVLWERSKEENILFFFECPNGCLPHRTFFADGEEYRPKKEKCPDCRSDMDHKSERTNKDKISSTDICRQCGYEKVFEYELGAHKEKVDPDFEKDRARFCLTDEEAKEAMMTEVKIDLMKKLAEEWKDKEEKKDEYDALEKIQKISILDLEKNIVPAVEKVGYQRFQLGTPDIGKDFFLPFTVYDGKSERTNQASTQELAKAIKKTLADTNWRLMSDGISYRLGLLSGRLRAYEREEDLMKLATQKITKKS